MAVLLTAVVGLSSCSSDGKSTDAAGDEDTSTTEASGSGDTSTTAAATDGSLAGTWQGTWTSLDDPADTGTSVWTISEDGVVEGDDLDPGRNVRFAVTGTIDPSGAFEATSVPDGALDESIAPDALAPATTVPPAGLAGTFLVEGDEISGELTWQVEPPLAYRYELTRE